ncbi:type II secretion system minor pseudopilin GspK [Ramlibacter sp. WS9]|uniref:type II secretion system minor pseudopilin GspK n=1 Tax=Ramlibacter sp. WS9 TaxID=1882741 RepID=UPI001142DC7F|nr:type II secretion system minor pseudopilin GspK [Ramlibacter sp. WS9]ROZ79492.1 general secretion pathway protein GspK [Ramlibacter sp. WS9]
MKRQRGAALLAAMLTVTLVATFAAAALWQQWRSTEVEAAERTRVQSAWILTGALDWARLLLREDGRPSGPVVDHLGEPWAVPLKDARLSSFLAADSNTTAETGPEVLEAFLSGQIIDMHSLLNINRLVDDQLKVSPKDLKNFQRLFELLGLPPSQLDTLVENLRFAIDTSTENRSGSAAPLLPQKVGELVWLGLPVGTVAALQPYVSVLPRLGKQTSVNLNTASPEVIYASVEGLSMADAQRLVALRERTPFKSVAEALQAIGFSGDMGELPVGVASNYFEVRARLRLDQLVVEERSLLLREGTTVTTLQRERGIADPTALAQAASAKR